MKIKLLILTGLLLLTLISCMEARSGASSHSTSSSTTEITFDDPTDDTPEILPEEPAIDKKFLVKTNLGLYFSDGVSLEYFLPASTIKVATYNFVSGSSLIILDASGDIDSSTDLGYSPDAGLITSGVFYSCIEISPAEAVAVGARPDTYTEIFIDGISEPWQWLENTFGCDRIIKSGDSVFILDGAANYVIDGPAENITHISSDFYIHDRDPMTGLIFFNNGTDNQETYSTNFILSAENWQKFGDLYYSENGFTWSSADELREDNTAMYDFTSYPYPIEPELLFGESPVLLSAGIVDNKLLWVDCTSGYLFEFNPQTNTYEQKYRLYIGDGTMVSGTTKRDTLKPMIIENKLYFSNDGSLNVLDMATGENNIFNGGQSEVMNYD